MPGSDNIHYAPEDPTDWNQPPSDVAAALDEIANKQETSTTDQAIARYNGTAGKLDDSKVTISDTGDMTFTQSSVITGSNVTDLQIKAHSVKNLILDPSGNDVVFEGRADLSGNNVINVGDLELDSLTKDGTGEIQVNDDVHLLGNKLIFGLSGDLGEYFQRSGANQIDFVLNSAARFRFTNTTLSCLGNHVIDVGILECDSIQKDGSGNLLIEDDTDWSSTGAITLPVGTTAQRPGSPSNGMLRYNSTTNKFEGYENGAWANLI